MAKVTKSILGCCICRVDHCNRTSLRKSGIHILGALSGSVGMVICIFMMLMWMMLMWMMFMMLCGCLTEPTIDENIKGTVMYP